MMLGSLRVGQVLAGTYELTAVLGVGGMGTVYEARDVALGRRVAVKVNKRAYGEYLRREAQALAAVRHPGFVTVHHLGVHEDREFLVMERLFGETLHARLDDARRRNAFLPLGDVLDVLIPIADALSAAHRAGVVQRDLKPANVFLAGERVVLIDMGLFVPEVLVTPETDCGGTPEYVAPEVVYGGIAKGEAALVDLYAFGILAYELLTNVTPFADEGGSVARVLSRHVAAPVPDVSAVREVPHPLAALVSELLAKDPHDRPPSAEAVLWQLRHLRNLGSVKPRHLRVLAVDDQPDVGWILKRALEDAFPSLEVEATTDPRRATQGKRTADLVIVDLNMPQINGVEVCMNLLALPPESRPTVVAMSAQAREADVEVLRSLGVAHFVPKNADFVGAISAVIGDLRIAHAHAA